jgi:hypothetical protein
VLARGPHLPPGPEQLGAVELILDEDGVRVRFLTVPGLVELEPGEIPEVRSVLDELAADERLG